MNLFRPLIMRLYCRQYHGISIICFPTHSSGVFHINIGVDVILLFICLNPLSPNPSVDAQN